MRGPATWLGVLLSAAAAMGQTPSESPPGRAEETPRPRRALQLKLDTLYTPGYEAARELRLALSDSPMVRLELAALREQLAVPSPGPSGVVISYGRPTPLTHVEFTSEAQGSLVEQWKRWGEMSPEDKLVTGLETGLVLWTFVELAKRAH